MCYNNDIKRYNNRHFHCRIVSLEMATNMSTEITVLCDQSDCELSKPLRMAVVEDKLLVLGDVGKLIYVSDGKSNCSQ